MSLIVSFVVWDGRHGGRDPRKSSQSDVWCNLYADDYSFIICGPQHSDDALNDTPPIATHAPRTRSMTRSADPRGSWHVARNPRVSLARTHAHRNHRARTHAHTHHLQTCSPGSPTICGAGRPAVRQSITTSPARYGRAPRPRPCYQHTVAACESRCGVLTCASSRVCSQVLSVTVGTRKFARIFASA